jgi:hypothetical protein
MKPDVKYVLGHSRPSQLAPVPNNVRFASDSDQIADMPRTTLCAISDIMRVISR